MFKNLNNEAKIAVLIVAAMTFVIVAPIFWGGLALLATITYWFPWPAIMVTATILFLAMSWTIMWGRVKSHLLLFLDCLTSALLLLFLIGVNSGFGIETNVIWAMIIYGLSIIQVAMHAAFVLITIIDLQIVYEPEVEPAEPGAKTAAA